MGRGVLRQKGVRIATHADYRNIALAEIGHKAEQFVGLARIGNGQHHILRGYHTQVAMKGIQRIDKETRRTRTGERGSNLRTDMSTLPHPCHNQLAPTVEDYLHSAIKVVIKAWNQVQQGLRLIPQTLNGGLAPQFGIGSFCCI